MSTPTRNARYGALPFATTINYINDVGACLQYGCPGVIEPTLRMWIAIGMPFHTRTDYRCTHCTQPYYLEEEA